MGTGFKLPIILTHLAVSKAGFKLALLTANAAGRGRPRLRASPKLLWGLGKRCLAETGKLVLSSCTP